MKRKWLNSLLVGFAALGLCASGFAFDGGGSEPVDPDPMEPDYVSYHALCMEREMRMWGEVAELMNDLATAQCHCEFTQIEQSGVFTHAAKQKASEHCARRGSRHNKEAFIRWAMPRHDQRINSPD